MGWHSGGAHCYDGRCRHQRVGGVRPGGVLVWHEAGQRGTGARSGIALSLGTADTSGLASADRTEHGPFPEAMPEGGEDGGVVSDRAVKVWAWIAAAHVGDGPVSVAAVCTAAACNLSIDGASVTVMRTLLVGEPLFASDQ